MLYLFNPYFVKIGRKYGLLPTCESKILAMIKNKIQSFSTGRVTKYHDLFILAYRDGKEMSDSRLNEVINMLQSSMPINSKARRNNQAQILGFKLVRKEMRVTGYDRKNNSMQEM